MHYLFGFMDLTNYILLVEIVFCLFKYRVDYFISWCIIIMLCSFCLYILLHVLFLHCIYFALLCRILAYWLMLSVLNTTLNKDYSILFYSILTHTVRRLSQPEPPHFGELNIEQAQLGRFATQPAVGWFMVDPCGAPWWPLRCNGLDALSARYVYVVISPNMPSHIPTEWDPLHTKHSISLQSVWPSE